MEIIELNNQRVQIATDGNWLHDGKDPRYFTKKACLAINDSPWLECTNDEKVQWEKEHNPEPEPLLEEVEEPQEAEVEQ